MAQKKLEARSVSCFTILLLVVTMINNMCSITLGLLNSYKNGYFRSTLEELIDKYHTENTPQLTSSVLIFTFVYTFNTVGIIYLLLSIRLPHNHSPLKVTPSLVSKNFLLSCNIAYLSSIAWSFFFDKEHLEICCGLQTCATIFLWTAAFISFYDSRRNLREIKQECKSMLWLVRILIQNGICLFATWAFVTSTIGLASALVYENSFGLPKARLRGIVSMKDGSAISLIVMMFGLVVLFILEIFAFRKYFKYILTTVPVFVVAFAGMAANLHIKKARRNLKLCFLGITLSMTFLVIKLIVLSMRLGKKKKSTKKTN